MVDFLHRTPKKDLRVKVSFPQSWAHCTTEQLEFVSRVLIDAAKKYNTTGEYSQGAIMTRLFFYFTDMEVIERNDDESFLCQFKQMTDRKARQTIDGKLVPIRITPQDIAYLSGLIPDEIDKKGNPVERKDGMMWVFHKPNLVNFPYPTFSLPDPSSPRRKRKMVEFVGPSHYMQNFSWRQYRNASDYMNYLAKAENTLAQYQQNQIRVGSERIRRQEENVRQLRAGFLATIFNAKVPHIDDETHERIIDFAYVSSQSHDNARFFLDFPEEKCQVVLLWWQSMMQYLSAQYPKVFTATSVGKQKDDDPFKTYTRSITTMAKYTGGNEGTINRTTYTIILQHINDMAEENERIEQMKKK